MCLIHLGIPYSDIPNKRVLDPYAKHHVSNYSYCTFHSTLLIPKLILFMILTLIKIV